ncbi:MAG TPA: Gfo/Idh/MocA family oxidoreductase [Candidatus Krumholzibacteria bacterium]|nr:Gfo/Idh/MocA family oxidoreductase [Candidatus Krumholzibacteria bacterium]HPD71504.1 Gfo/Idh/MocA family oxidoreductase [Candidatus Krumholzibacteria bacterium]HRY41563.1 Gfo/Idh/MocA family oxidoreductase [Candidatus Krumholzibacteria bacterium]
MIRMGVIGCGYWGPNLIRNFQNHPGVELVSMADIDVQRLQRVGNLYPTVRRFTDYREITGDPTLDAVVVATPVSTHFPLGMEVLTAGKHLFLEKPMAASSEECRRLLDAADSRGLVIMVGHTFLFAPAVRKISKLMAAGDLGDIYYVSITRVNLGIFQKDVNVVWDLAPHDIAMLNHLFAAYPSVVSATGRSYVQVDKGIEDVAFLTLEYPGRQIAHIHVSWLDPNKIRRATFVGSRKMLVYDDVDPTEKIKVYDKGVEIQPHYDNFGEFQLTLRSGDIFVPRIDMTEPLKIEAQHFVDVIKGEAEAISSGRHGLEVVEVLEKACQSIKDDGQPVELIEDV